MKKSLIYISLIALLAVPFGLYYFSPSDEYSEISQVSVDTVTVHLPPPSEMFYDIVIDSLDIIQNKIRYGQTLGDLLTPHAIEYSTINTLVNAAKNVYDVRKLIAGKDYYILVSKDSIRKAHYFLFEPNPYEYVVYSLQDSIYANKVSKPISLVEKTFAGVIESSVYQTMIDNGGSPELVNRMVDVFAWQVDFFRIQAGDKMKVIYEEEQIDGVPVGVGRIKAAYFDHFGKEFYAIHYDQGSGIDFFDEEGNSLRKAFLKAPLNYTRISSTFSGRRFHPVLKRFKSHLGTDYAAPTGTPIRSVGDGVVVEASFTSGNGNYVKVKHNATYTTQYLHMSKIANTVKRGVRVSQGQTIGFVGSTGLATGPHLCFRFWKNGEQVNALKVEMPPSEPIFEKHRPTFNYVSKSFRARLDALHYTQSDKKADVQSASLQIP